ncbi:MAG: hypothetical protein SWO11_13055 [Thermodesulfobacteriota bacterium]|nr:hypothetical protein [Thermodesulfobacteriota bacterium]
MLGFTLGSLSLLITFNLLMWQNKIPLTTTRAFIQSLVLVAFPWALGIALAYLERCAFRLRFKDSLRAESQSFLIAPLAVVAAIPVIAIQLPIALPIWFLVLAGNLLLRVYFVGRIIEPPLLDRAALALLLLTFILGLFALFQTCIYHDALWTYGYLRSILLDSDLSLYNEFILHNSYFMYVPHPHEPIFYCGAGLIMLPFFLFGHLIATLLPHLPGVFLDGYSWPYTVFTSLGGVTTALIGLILLYRINRHFFTPLSSITSVLLMLWTSNLCFYTFVWPLYSHVFSLSTIALFILLWLKRDNSMTSGFWMIWGMTLGLATWIRPQNILFCVLPFCDIIFLLNRKQIPFRQIIKVCLYFTGGVLLCFSPQMALWYRTSGEIIVDTYAHIGDEFFWFRPNFMHLFFSLKKGFFTWTPVFLLTIPGFIFLCRISRYHAWVLLLSFALQAYIVASYEFPDGGAGFGSRYLINCIPFLSLSLAAFSKQIHEKGWILFSLVSLFLVYTNLGMIIMYQLEMIPHNNYTPHLAELIQNIYLNAPTSIEDFVFSSHINENVFARNSILAIQGESYTVMMLLIYPFICSIMWIITIAILAFCASAQKKRKALFWSGIITAVFIAVDVHLLLLQDGPQYQKIWPALTVAYDRQEAPPAIKENEFTISEEHPVQRILINYQDPVNIIDVTSTFVEGFNIPPGTELAKLNITNIHNESFIFHIINDVDTAEYSAFHVKAAEKVWNYTIPKKRVVHHWLSRDNTGYYFGSGYFQRFILPQQMRIKRIDFEYIASQGKLIVNGLILALK